MYAVWEFCLPPHSCSSDAQRHKSSFLHFFESAVHDERALMTAASFKLVPCTVISSDIIDWVRGSALGGARAACSSVCGGLGRLEMAKPIRAAPRVLTAKSGRERARGKWLLVVPDAMLQTSVSRAARPGRAARVSACKSVRHLPPASPPATTGAPTSTPPACRATSMRPINTELGVSRPISFCSITRAPRLRAKLRCSSAKITLAACAHLGASTVCFAALKELANCRDPKAARAG